MLALRRLPWLSSTVLRPVALPTAEKSSAMRAGDWMLKPLGSSVSGLSSSTRTTSLPPSVVVVMARMVFCACDQAVGTAATAPAISTAARRRAQPSAVPRAVVGERSSDRMQNWFI